MLQRTPLSALPSIQILRAVAALAIVVHHALHDADLLARKAGSSFAWQNVFPLSAGVDLFFVISGFVMVYATQSAFGSAHSILPFLKRRAARIVPIYWVATLLFLIVTFSGIAAASRAVPAWGEIAASFFFIPYMRPDALIQPVFGLGWTLNYEVFFYIIFALFLPLQRPQAVACVVATLMALVVIGHFVPPSQTIPHFWTRPIILEFGYGVILGHMALEGIRPTRKLALVLVMSAIGLLAAGQYLPQPLQERSFAFGLPAALLVLAALGLDDAVRDNPLSNSLSRFGDASYALYLLHPFALKGLAIVGGAKITAISPLLFVAIGVTLSCIVAMMVWRWFEKPLTKALQGSKAY
ncbi:MAG: acyltransferase family protein [Beijerinckiaceae bacterium]